MNYLKLASLLLIQYTSAAPARLSDDTIAATDDLLGSLGIDLKKSSQMAAKQCFDLSMNSFDCMTKQAMTLSGKELALVSKTYRTLELFRREREKITTSVTILTFSNFLTFLQT